MIENFCKHFTKFIHVIDFISFLQRITTEKIETKKYFCERFRRRREIDERKSNH